jgi:signal peptidase I
MNREIYKNKEFTKDILGYALTFIISIFITILINKFVLSRADIDGMSMQCTLQDKDVTFVEKISSLTHNFKRGQIVIFNSNNKNKDIYIKRIIGVAGDQIQINNGKVYLNKNQLTESYLNANTVTTTGPYLGNTAYTVPPGYVFVLGDNRADSLDSRFFGVVNVKDILGHAIVRVYPFNKIGTL